MEHTCVHRIVKQMDARLLESVKDAYGRGPYAQDEVLDVD